MDNFKVIYRILKYLEASMDCSEIDTDMISASALNITEERWRSIIIMLLENGYIKGVEAKKYQRMAVLLNTERMQITLKGLEYLEENSLMQKAKNLAKDVINIIK